MGTMRRVVLPVLRLIVWAVIAIALCVIAFRETAPTFEEGDDGTVIPPGAAFTDPVVDVTTQTVINAVDLTGTIEPEPSTEVTAPGEGTAVYFAMSSGATVEEGDPLMTVRTTSEREPLTQTDADGNVTTIPQSPQVVDTTVHATADGVITFAVELNDQVGQGDVVARIDPGETFITATIPPESLYRLIDLPDTAEVAIANGPEPFDCTRLKLVTSSGEEGSTTEVRCEVPEDVTVFPGLQVTLTVVTDRAEEAAVVPLTAVRGTYESGSVWLVEGDGEPVETPVALGLTDGKVVQVTEGLEVGDTILQFVPGTPAVAPDGDGMGEEGMVDDGSGEDDTEESESVDDGAGG